MFKENIVAWRGTLRPHQTYCQDSHQKPSAINSSSVLRKVVQLYTMMYVLLIAINLLFSLQKLVICR